MERSTGATVWPYETYRGYLSFLDRFEVGEDTG